MKTRKNHEYLPDKNDPTKYIEYHIRQAVGPIRQHLEPTGRTFKLLKRYEDPDDAHCYFTKSGEMKLWNNLTETCIILKLNEEDND